MRLINKEKLTRTDKTEQADLEIGEFHFFKYTADGEPHAIRFRHPNCKFNSCSIAITKGEQSYPTFHWDGNKDNPTISPSIGCDARCGCHFHIVNGEFKP